MMGKPNNRHADRRDEMSARMQISIPPALLDALSRMSVAEDRSLSSMARILLMEAIAARAEDVSA